MKNRLKPESAVLPVLIGTVSLLAIATTASTSQTKHTTNPDLARASAKEALEFQLPSKLLREPPPEYTAPVYPGSAERIEYTTLPGKYVPGSVNAMIESKDSPATMHSTFSNALRAAGWQIVVNSGDSELEKHGYSKMGDSGMQSEFISATKNKQVLFFSCLSEGPDQPTVATISVTEGKNQ